MDFERGEILFFFLPVSFGGRGGFRFVGLGAIGGIVDILKDGWDSWGEWEMRWESGRVGEWDSGGAEGRQGEEEEAREGEYDGDGERWGWNGVCVYDCTDVNEYTRFTNEKE